jgi:hypothetical protein
MMVVIIVNQEDIDIDTIHEEAIEFCMKSTSSITWQDCCADMSTFCAPCRAWQKVTG